MVENELPNDGGTVATEKKARSIRDVAEAMRVLKEADESSVPVLDLVHPPIPVPTTAAEFIPSDIQDPRRQHDLCYNQIMTPLGRYLKDAPKKANKIIRAEVKLFLNEGATKGRDMRQTYFHLYEQAIEVIQRWIRQYGGNNLTGLFNAFRELNEQRQARQKVAGAAS